MRSWAALPTGKVVRLEGAGPLPAVLDSLPGEAPAILTCAAPEARSPKALVAAVLDELDATVLGLFPAWLPEAGGIDGPGGAGPAAVRALALRTAATTAHFGPFLAELAERALRARPGPFPEPRTSRSTTSLPSWSPEVRPSRFPPEVRAAGLTRALAAGRSRAGASLLFEVPDGLSPRGQEILVAAGEWLAHRARLSVWLAGPLPAVDHLETVRAPGPNGQPPTPRRSGGPPVTGRPPVAGRPHPASAAERALESALSGCGWAAGRAWNQTVRPSVLASPVRADLVWQDDRCVVEVDGPEHRGPDAFAGDRARDVRLQIAGYAVLRFTDAQVLTDPQAVVRHIELFLRNRRASEEG
ncbi:endonuclease domain-containing protein [Nonomuraea sp. CA-218870]|uniref:endonuclease domain-containing protein n=1 Tax=Nonomuraea sp. CA-218870 TaxID=3239998 RepID=UPI003D8CF73E